MLDKPRESRKPLPPITPSDWEALVSKVELLIAQYGRYEVKEALEHCRRIELKEVSDAKP